MANLSSLNFRLTTNIKPFKTGLTKAERSMDRFGRKMQQTGKHLTTNLTAPLVAIGAVSFNVFKNFEAEMSKVQAVSGATAEEFKALSDNAKELGASTMFSAREVASLQTEFAKLGFTATEITKVTESTLALAQASGSDLARSAEVAGSTLRAFGLDASETGRVTDVMAKSFSTSALDMEHFANSMKFVAPVAKSAGISIEETSAMLAVLANAGIKGSQAGTSLRRIISEIGASGKPTSEALKDLASQGLNLADAKDEVGRSAQSALLILSEGVDQIKPLQTQFENSAGAAQEMADIMGDTAFGASKRLESAMEGLGISIGEIVAQAVVPMIENLAALASRLNRASPATKKFVVVIGTLLASLGPLLMLTGGAIRNFKFLRVAMIRSTTATKAAAVATRIFNTVLKANPIGLAVTAVIALASAFALLNRKKKDAIDTEKKLSQEAEDEIANNQVRLTQANNLINTIKDQNISSEQRNRLINKLNTEYKDLLPNLIDEKDSVEDIAEAQKEMNKQMAKKIAMIALQDEISQATEKAVDAQKNYNSTLKLSDELATKSQSVFGRVLSVEEAGRLMNATNDITAEQQLLAREIFNTAGMLGLHKTQLDMSNQAVVQLSQNLDELGESLSDGQNTLSGNSDGTEELSLKQQMLAHDIKRAGEEIEDFIIYGEALTGALEEIEEEVEELDEPFVNFADNLAKINAQRKFLQDGMSTLGSVFQQAFQAGLTSGESFFKTLSKAFTDLAKKIAATALAALALAVILSVVFGGANVAGIKAFGVGFEGGFKELFVGIASSMGGIPGLAEGGIVTGPTLAMIGEGGESEAVIPLSKLSEISSSQSQNITVNGRISGQDILLSSEKANRTRTRFRGF
jgi:hypothetical protein